MPLLPNNEHLEAICLGDYAFLGTKLELSVQRRPEFSKVMNIVRDKLTFGVCH